MAENYDLIFGQGASSQYAWSDSDYQKGWQTVGSTPPTAEQFDALQRRSDTKAKDLNNRLSPLETTASKALARVTPAANMLPYFNSSNSATTTAISNFIKTLLDDKDAATARATLGAPSTTGANASGSWNINAATATKLATPCTISLTGNASGSANFDGSGNVSINTTVNESKHAAAAETAKSCTGNSATASKLSTARKINLTGNATGSAAFDGTSDVSINVTVNSATKATKATNDGNGANIASTYVKKAGDTITGKITFAATDINALPEVKRSDDNMSGIRFSSKTQFLGAVGKRLSGGEDLLNLRSDNTTTDVVLDSRNYGRYALPKSGGYISGPLNFPNTTWNPVGDDSYLGDHNIAGTFCVKGANGETGIALVNKENERDYACISYGGGDINFSKTIGGNISGNAATATKLATPRAISLTGNASGSANFDGSGNVSINTTVNESKHAVNADNATNASSAASATTAGNVSEKIYYSTDSPSVATDKLFVVKRALKTDNTNVLGYGLVIQTGFSAANNGKLYISDNGKNGVWIGGIDAGKEVDWTRLVENKGTWGISISGNAATATKLATARSIALTGNATGSATFDGSGNISISTNVNTATNADKLDGAHLADVYRQVGGHNTPTITSIIDWNTMKACNGGTDVRNIHNTTYGVTAYGGDSNFSSGVLKGYAKGSFYLTQDYTNFDKLCFLFCSDTGEDIEYTMTDVFLLNYIMTNYSVVNLSHDDNDFWVVTGYSNKGTAKDKVSTKRIFSAPASLEANNCGIVDVLGIKY